jgi:hypothetical protein
VNLLPPEARENKDVLDSLSNAYFALVSNGRSNGYTMCFATQSLTYIAKWAIKSSQIRVIMRHVEVNDLDMCERMIAESVASREQIESMPAGMGVVFGFTPKPMVVQFDRRASRDDSETPGIERLREVREVREVAPIKRLVADMTLDELAALLEARAVRPGGNDGPDTDALPEDENPFIESDPPKLTRLDQHRNVRAMDVQNKANFADENDVTEDYDAATYAQNTQLNQPVERTQPQSKTVKNYRLSEKQIAMFCALYPVHIANKDAALTEIGANSAYRAHANEIIEQYRLMEKKRG